MTYNFDITGDLLSLTNDMAGTANDVTYTLGYTAAHELSSEKISNSGYVFQPSKNGAGTDTYGTPNNLNQYVNVTLGGQALTFKNDNDGNLKNDGNNVYLYDPENHLMTTNTGSNGTWNYAYDPKGRRTTKSGTSTTYFLNDGDDEIAEYDGSGHLLTRYVPGAEIDQPIAVVPASGSNEYFHTDHHGTVIATSDSNENLDEGPFLYDSYGYCGTTCAGGEPFKYVGRYLDAETGLYYNRARYYSPQIGRFNQTDPVGYTADMDLYTYVGNDPIDRTDPSGNCAEDACVLEGTIAVGTGVVYGGAALAAATGICVTACNQIMHGIEHAVSAIFHNESAGQKGTAANDNKNPRPGSKGGEEHQAKVKERIEELKGQGMTHVGGGDKPEETVQTPGGDKSSRRPDITMEKGDGSRYRENVGRSNQNGQPVSREQKAQQDIQKATGQCAFSSYNSCK